jgi:hypothetical protein
MLLPMESHVHKKQLHDKIDRRRAQLEAARERMQKNAAMKGSERAHAVDDALLALKTHLGGDWNATSQMEALHLSSWLDSTEYLIEAADLAPHGS